MKSKLSSGDFKTLWKAIAAAPTILSKALTEANLNAAFHSTGAITNELYAMYQQKGTKDPSDKNIIMSRNPHFATEITGDQGQRVLDCIERAALIVNEKDHIPEDDYPELLGDADNCPPVTGMPLNLMVVNRQRCCILGDGLFDHRQEQKNAAEKAKINGKKKRTGDMAGLVDDDATKPKKKRMTSKVCSNNSCMKEEGDAKGFVKCKTKCCRMWFCSACNDSLTQHQTVCQQSYDKKQESKNDD